MPLDSANAKMLYIVHLRVTEGSSGRSVLETEGAYTAEELGGDPASFAGVVTRLAAMIDRDPNAVPFAGA
jgi:hypothetical protein